MSFAGTEFREPWHDARNFLSNSFYSDRVRIFSEKSCLNPIRWWYDPQPWSHLGDEGVHGSNMVGPGRRHIQPQPATQIGQAGPVQVATRPLNPPDVRLVGRVLIWFGSLGLASSRSSCFIFRFGYKPSELCQMFFSKCNLGKIIICWCSI